MITIGTLTIGFWPISAFFAIIMIVALAISLAHAAIRDKKIKHISDNFALGNYDDVIVNAEDLLYVLKMNSRAFSTRELKTKIDYLHGVLAVSYFSKGDDILFLKHINALTELGDFKAFWSALYYFRKGELKAAQKHYEAINDNGSTVVFRTFLESVELHRQGEYYKAKIKMKSIYDNLPQIVLKDIAEEILSQ